MEANSYEKIRPNALVKLKRRKKVVNSVQGKENILNHEPLMRNKRMLEDHELDLPPKKKPCVGQPQSLDQPTDWSLKSKIRFTSSQPFTWMLVTKATHEADAIAAYVQAEPISQDVCTAFQQSLLVWTHPYLPFVSMFPRGVSKSGSRTSLVDKELEALKDQWSASFQSLFQQLRADLCPYFYLCADSFTVLFISESRAVSMATNKAAMAIIGPTTSGFRQTLRKEGVKFYIPGDGSNMSGSTSSDEDEGCGKGWLDDLLQATPTSLGTRTHTQAPPTSTRNSAIPVSLTSTDRYQKSVLTISDTDLRAFVNFLLNSKSLISSTGTHAGLPPTLISPSPFQSATLTSLKSKVSVVQEQCNGKLVTRHCADVTGPILPDTLVQLKQLMHRTQQSDLTTKLNHIDATEPFTSAYHNVMFSR